MSDEIQRLKFPTGGLRFSPPVSLQTPDTSPGALNIRSFSAEDDDIVGGSRSGTSKWHSALITGSAHNIQDVNGTVISI